MERSDLAVLTARPPADADASHRGPLTAGQGIALCVLGLLTIGVVMVNSAGMSVDASRAVTAESLLLSKSTIYMGLAMLGLTVSALLPIRRIAERLCREPSDRTTGRTGQSEPWLRDCTRHWLSLWPLWAFVAAMIGVLCLVYMPVIGKEVNSSHRWINLHVRGLDSVQPSEIAKWGLVAVVAWYAARRAALMPDFLRGLAPALAAIAAVCAVVVLEDFGTGVLIGAATCIILLAAGARLWQFALFVPFAALGLAVALLTSPYRVKRLTAFLDPYADPERTGYHMIQSMLAVSGGEGWGRGLGFGLQKFGYLPEDHNDFLFAVICEELGIAGAAVTIAIYIALVWAGFAIVRREREPFLRLLALGIIATIGLQALINLTVVTGLGPTKGIALPLVSSGGTGWLLTALSMGVLIAIDRTRPRDDTVAA